MAEIRREVRILEVAMRCKACGLGEMFSTGITLMSNPPQYPHKCRACGAEETLLRRYPYIANEPVPSGVPASDRPYAVGDDIAAIRAARIAGVAPTADQGRIYVWLGYWRDKMPPEAVAALQDILGPLNAGVAPVEAPSYTYASTQATNCARCGKHKHTPLRVDRMDGYVCLTCIDEELERLLNDEAERTSGVQEGGK